MKTSYSIGLIVIASAFYACRGTDNAGGESGQDRQANETTTQSNVEPSSSQSSIESSSSADLVSDSSLASSDISSQTGEALSSTMNMDISSGLGLMLTASLDGTREQDRDCTVGDDSTEVSISREFSKSFEKDRGEFSFAGGFTKATNITRKWTKADGAEIPCNEDATHISYPLVDFEGVKLSAEFSKEFSRSMTKTDAEANVLETRLHSAITAGSREVSWDSVVVNEENNSISLQKTISFSAESTLTRPDQEGNSKIDTISLVTAEDAPLVVAVTRDGQTKQWLERTIVSGSTIGTHKDGGSIHLSYDNAKFEYAQGCEPLAGTISGEIYLAGSEVPDRSFVIDLAEATKTITFTNGEGQEITEELELELAGCDFDSPKSELVKRVKKAKQRIRSAVANQNADKSAEEE
ncbi:MAG: hypothetical protein AB8G05_19860 [Oligoflexales bacterium]